MSLLGTYLTDNIVNMLIIVLIPQGDKGRFYTHVFVKRFPPISLTRDTAITLRQVMTLAQTRKCLKYPPLCDYGDINVICLSTYDDTTR